VPLQLLAPPPLFLRRHRSRLSQAGLRHRREAELACQPAASAIARPAINATMTKMTRNAIGFHRA
jgi:hypothetical protein